MRADCFVLIYVTLLILIVFLFSEVFADSGLKEGSLEQERRMPWGGYVSTHCLVETGVIKLIFEVFSLTVV